MTLKELKLALDRPGTRNVRFGFADGGQIEPHFHVTEVGKVTKDFVDCGGTRRTTESCVLQTYVANDFEHRLGTDTLAKVLQAAEPLALDDELPVEVEYQLRSAHRGTIGLYQIAGCDISDEAVTLMLAPKATACLAPDRCGIEILPQLADSPPCCGESGCC